MIKTGFLYILGAGLFFGLIHSFLASDQAKSLGEHIFSQAGKRYYRLFYVVMAAATTALYGSTVLIFPDRTLYLIPIPWLLATLLVQILAAIAAFISIRQSGILPFLGMDVLFHPNLKAPAEKLIQSGFYKYMRHPVYTFGIVVIWLFPIMTWNLLALFLGATIYMIIGAIFEERRLLTVFGEEYQKYKKRTPAFVPKPFRNY